MLVDDNPAIVRQTISLLPPEFEVVEVLENAEQLVASIALHKPDLIVLDITLPGENGLDAAARLEKAGCTAKIVFLTVHTDPDYARAAFAAGALGYVVKPRLASDLAMALHAALAGNRFISPCVDLKEVQ